jgi:MFS family permease
VDAPDAAPVGPWPPEKRADWGKRVLLVVVGLLTLGIVGYVGAAFVPRWWSHRIGDQVNGSIASGILIGLAYGFVFTVLPLLVLMIGFRRRRSWRSWLFVTAVAVVLAAPNLMTLGIVLGRGNAAHAGERTLDVEAPGFRGATLAGALLAAAAVALFWYLVASRRRARRLAAEARAELAARDRPGAGPPEPAP